MARYKVHLCGTGDSDLVISHQECSHKHLHTSEPSSYMDWFSWAQEMSRSHRQKKCPYCKYYCIWVLK